MPLALAYMRTLERFGARVLNGADVFALELSKSAQATLLRTLGIDTPGRSPSTTSLRYPRMPTRFTGRLSLSPIKVAAAHVYTS